MKTLLANASVRSIRTLQLMLIAVALLATASHVPAQSLTATIVFPPNGATGADLTQPFTWTSVADVQAYYLYVGSTQGAKDIVNTGELQTTSYQAGNLPTNQTLHARLWTKVAGVWRYTDSTFSAATTVVVSAVITYPPDGATAADRAQPIRWTSVPGVQAYYLYVGTTPGANNLINTGETLQTSYSAASLPLGQVVYARLWTKVAGVWRYRDSSFTETLLMAAFTYPLPGATTVNEGQPWTWTAVPNVQAYYLYVGSTLGAKDLVNTGEIQTTSYLPPGLPWDRVLYVRLWTKLSGVWRSTDTTFTMSQTARLIFPQDGDSAADLTHPFEWTAVANAQVYYLFVGRTPGAGDFVNTGEVTTTTHQAVGLPIGETLHARLWTRVGGVWRYRDHSFVAASGTDLSDLVATLAYPADEQIITDKSAPAMWLPVEGAQAYYLYVGREPGGFDVINSGEIQATTYSLQAIPIGPPMYARLWTKVGGVWRGSSSSFAVAGLAAEFTQPLDGDVNVDTAMPFEWTSVPLAEGYKLQIGSTMGAADLFDSGSLNTTSLMVGGLPETGTLYARVSTRLAGSWARHSDIAFSRGPAPGAATMIAPVNGQNGFDTVQPFEWSAVTLARRYRLTIGTASGGSDLHDSGEIGVTRRFVPGLPTGVTLHGRISTKIDGQWTSADFQFVVSANTFSVPTQMANALWATDQVRHMAGSDNRPFGWTALAAGIAPRYNALCTDYANSLLAVLQEMNHGMARRSLTVSFNPNGFDTHTLTELLDPTTNRWVIMDPTFGLAAVREDGAWASADDISQAARNQDWSAISYTFTGVEGDAFARGYYLDYPLLFLNRHQGNALIGQAASVLPYVEPVALPASGPAAFYLVRCTTGASTIVDAGGTELPLLCDGTESFSKVFIALSVADPGTGSPFLLYRVRRFVF